jgi:hypothetical protein
VVLWSQEAIDDLERLNRGELKGTIEQVLALDPRPRVAKNDAIFGMSFAGLNIKFQSRGSEIFVAGVTVGEKSKRAK